MKKLKKAVVLGALTISFLGMGGEKVFADIYVKNIEEYNNIKAAVNTYGSGQSHYYTISPKKTEKWSRSDSKGFLVSVDYLNKQHDVYYSNANASYYIQDNQLKISGGGTKTAINKEENRYVKNSSGGYNSPSCILSGREGQIRVHNLDNTKKISVSTWDGGDSSFYKVANKKTETWKRSWDNRGYLLNVDGARYFIMSGEAAVVEKGSVYINNKLARQISNF
ncbi:hypothetical protein [Enterococcus mundtii]|uniref:Uncharacterized protein n=1 Tax=Enterococcus mundtii TaxID=53346 RepID=A0A242KFI4_ENTMU|nr:hypothetical protein [Enterococcus mundtii]OTP19931.1 hypothetical protein A5802_003335 [Enterococcus mundtii]